MKNRLRYLLLGCVLALSVLPAFALSMQSQYTLSAFKRYEPEYSIALRDLQAMSKRLEEIDDPDLMKISEIWLKAEYVMKKIEERYESMEDFYRITLSKNKGDALALQEGFNRLEDAYRQVRDYYTDNYTYRDKKPEYATKKEQGEELNPTPILNEKVELFPTNKEERVDVISAEDQEPKQEESAIRLTGSLKFDLRSAEEKHQSLAKGGKLPNDQTQGRMLFTYKLNEKRQWNLEERYLNRERNEKIRENHLTLSYFSKFDEYRGMTFRNSLQHIWYPDGDTKDFRINLFESIYSKTLNDHERTIALGFKTKVYPRASNFDYNQYNFSDQETWYKKNSIIFTELKGEIIKYRNVANLDYNNINLYADMNKTYSGNNAEVKVTNTYERRLYDNESVVAYRTSYYDDFFNLYYELPVNDRVTYNFATEYSKRNYSSDRPRGYSEVNIFNAVAMKTDDRTLLSGDYRYIYNDENTRDYAHKNNHFHVGLMRIYDRNTKLSIDETYHTRNSVQNSAIDFAENTFSINYSWQSSKSYNISWNTEHFIRRYDNISVGIADYRYIESGIGLSYSKYRNYDWQISQKWRKLDYRNWNGVATDWIDHVQPVTEAQYNKWLNRKLKLAIRCALEKTYYREFNNNSQELEYNFDDLMYNKEVYASLEYYF